MTQIGGIFLFAIIIIVLPFFASAFIQNVVMKALIFSIFALSLNILWGYTGLPSLGHAAYFGVGGYALGILMINYGIYNFWVLALAGIVFAVIFAAILGIPALRMSGAYFLLVTLAMGQLIFSLAQKLRTVTQGDTGLGGIAFPNLHIPGVTLNSQSYYYLVFIAFVICAFLIYRILHSPFGEALQGIRENEIRMKAIGYNTWLYRYVAFIIAGLFAGVAGVFFAPFNNIVSPVHLGIETSTMVMLMVVLGGPSKPFGPVLGAIVVVALEQVFIIYSPERWPLIFGAVFVLSVMFLRQGISVYLIRLGRKLTRGRIGS
jgi:branched-chain amino acid transport system permease protein